MLLHKFAHVETGEFNTEHVCHLFRDLGLADTRGPGKEEGADGFLGSAQSRARSLDGGNKGMDGAVLAKDYVFEFRFQVSQVLRIGCRDTRGGDFGDVRHDVLDLLYADHGFALASGKQLFRGARLVDYVDGLVRHEFIVDIFCGKLGRSLDGGIRIPDGMELLVIRTQALQYINRFPYRGLKELYLLEPPGKGTVLLKIVFVFLIGAGADAAQPAGIQDRLQDVRRIHRTAACGPRSDDRVNLVDEEDDAGDFFKLPDGGLQARLEIAPVFCAGKERPHVE